MLDQPSGEMMRLERVLRVFVDYEEQESKKDSARRKNKARFGKGGT